MTDWMIFLAFLSLLGGNGFIGILFGILALISHIHDLAK